MTDTSAEAVDRAVEIVCDEFGYTRHDLTQQAEAQLCALVARVQEVEAKLALAREVLKTIERGKYDGLEVTRLNAVECRVVAGKGLRLILTDGPHRLRKAKIRRT
jgi:hypothetical protein